MADKLGWRSFWWFNTGLCAFTVICCIFLFPETRYHRTSAQEDVQLMVKSSPVAAESNDDHSKPSAEEINQISDPEIVSIQQTNTNNLKTIMTHQDPYLGRGKPCKQQWKLWQPYRGDLLRELWLPFRLSLFPIVELAAFVVSWSSSAFLTLNLTQSQVFAAPPYNWSNRSIGFTNFAILIGVVIGLFTAGPLSDWISMKLTARNRGIREPEMRLVGAIPYVLIMIIGNIVVALGYEHQWDWKVSS